MAVKKKMQMGGKAKPMSGAIGAYSKLKGKDLELEKANYKKFGDGPGSGPSGAMPKPKKKMGGAVKKAKDGFDLNNDGKTTFKDVLIGRGVLPKTAKKGASVKKCRYGCK